MKSSVYCITRPTIIPLFSAIQPPWSLVSLLSSDIPAKMLTLQRLSICYCLSLENSSPRHLHGLLPYILQVSTQMTFSKRPSQTTSYKVALYSLLSPSSVWFFFFPWCSSVPVVYSLPCFFGFCVLATPCSMLDLSPLTRDRTHTPCIGRAES